MEPPRVAFLLLAGALFSLCCTCAAQPGFVSIDCGGSGNYTDEIGLNWIPDNNVKFGQIANISITTESRRPYTSLRYFPVDNNRKFCYTLEVRNKTRYLVRATFLYGNFDNNNVYPKFELFFGATHWSTIVISDTSTTEVRELIFLASSPTASVCLSKATTGLPFISTLELRQFNGSLYTTDFETQFYLSLSARINFGADTIDSVRFPDDPFDRLWQSDSLKKANYLVDVAPGTKKVSTSMPVAVSGVSERPPMKVMQTAVVGTEGSLTYRLNLNGFPGFGWAVSYFAEIEDLGPNETRRFRLILQGPDSAIFSKPIVDVKENALGPYRSYEPGYPNISFPFVFPFQFKKTNDSTRGPILNALEIHNYLRINFGSMDATTMASLASNFPLEDWAQEGGDPCLPVPWSWVQCSTDPQPKIVSIILSGRNVTGIIPSELSKLSGLVELWLDNNSLVGPIPDLTGCANLKKIHLENNQLTGVLPSSLAELPNLKELFVQNNMLSGALPSELHNKDINLNYTGTMLFPQGKSGVSHVIIIVCSVLGGLLLLAAAFTCYIFSRKRTEKSNHENFQASQPAPQKLYSFLTEVGTETSHKFSLSELEDATGKFGKRVGSGGYGVVYYGKMRDGKEVAVKVLTNDSYQGNKEFSNEVSLLSRIHHRNLVTFLGYCQEDRKNILVYEFMHNGTLKEHLYGPLPQGKVINWIERLEIAADAAKGLEYLHTGCTQTIIHRDVKSSNILLDKNMKAKVADFGLSKLAVDGSSHVSSIVRGTVGYLDPEYYISQQLTDKSDVYSFGVILLELISGQEAISNERFGVNCRNIVQWAKSHIESGDINGIIDPALGSSFNIQSVWKIAEKALSCVQPHGVQRPTMSEVLKEIQEAISIERGSDSAEEGELDVLSRHSMHPSANMDSLEVPVSDANASFSDSVMLPMAR